MEYIKNLDGLRALSVIVVVLNHIYDKLCPGGFLGVDVFFVLSGYVITNVVYEKYISQNESMRSFYVKRFLRLYPNLMCMILFTLIANWFYFKNDIPQSVYMASLTSLLAVSNVYYCLMAVDYWRSNDEFNPLLHTWSLGVEEQFYMFYIPFLFLLRNKYVLITFTASIFGISLMYSYALSVNGNCEEFYLLISRAWELLIGVLVYFVSCSIEIEESDKRIANIVGHLGLIIVIIMFWQESFLKYSFSIFHKKIIVDVATVMILLNSHANQGMFILNNQYLSQIGKCSYSIYLWHLPIIVFARILFPSFYNYTWFFLPMMVFIFSVALIAYLFVENTMRSGKSKISINYTLPVSIYTLITLLVTTGYLSGVHTKTIKLVNIAHDVYLGKDVTTNKQLVNRYISDSDLISEDKKMKIEKFSNMFQPTYANGHAYECFSYPQSLQEAALKIEGIYDVVMEQRISMLVHPCEYGGNIHLYNTKLPQIFAIGSSHMTMYCTTLDRICKEKKLSIAMMCGGGMEMDVFNHKELWDNIDKYLRYYSPSVVLIADKWDRYSADDVISKCIRPLCERYKDMKTMFVFIQQAPCLEVSDSVNLREYVYNQSSSHNSYSIYENYHKNIRLSQKEQMQIVCDELENALFLRVDDILLNDDSSVKYIHGDKFVYADDDHLSEFGASLIEDRLKLLLIQYTK